jgi:hypothetical protein
MIEIAIKLARAGISVFPCEPARKTPSIRKWRDNSTTDIPTIERWWRVRANHLVAIDLHKAGLLVLDGDRHPDDDGVIYHDGVEALRDLFRAHGYGAKGNPVTWTAGGGVHVYFRSRRLGNGTGDLPSGIDVRGSGGCVIAPECVLPDGRKYRPADGHPSLVDASIPELPAWLAEIIKPPRPVLLSNPSRLSSSFGKRGERFAHSALNGMARDLRAMPANSGRNHALNRAAWRMGTMVNRGWIDRATVERGLLEAAASLVHDDGAPSVRATLTSGLNAGLHVAHPDLHDDERG